MFCNYWPPVISRMEESMEIFDHSKVHRILDGHVSRRTEFFTHFKRLEQAAREIAAHKQLLDLGITFPTTSKEDCFDVYFAGKTFRFAFEYPVIHEDRKLGRIELSAAVTEKQNEQPTLVSIHFDKAGESDLKDEQGDGVSLFANNTVLGLIFLNALRVGSQI